MDLPKLYDWERIRLALRQLDASFPGLLQSVVLIGGGAAWFYRESLRQLADADFPVPASGPAEEEIWLSKDVDFMGLTVAEAALLYAEKCALLARKARPQDDLHHALLARFLQMKVTLSWLRQYVDFNWSPDELTKRRLLFGCDSFLAP